MKSPVDIEFMKRALEAARKGWGTTHPNPMVGALIVEKGEIAAEGHHATAGGPHAEIVALRNLGRSASREMTLYTTLEPCCTHGKTPPCTEAIIASGIGRVVAGATDPNPLHGGKGFDQMRLAGIEVVEGVLQNECEDLNLIFNHWIARGEPLLAGKIATTIDGRIATRTGQSQWITGEKARADVMRWRRLFPAIGVGAGTVLADNPSLTSRLGGEVWCPLRFVFDTGLRTVRKPELNLFCDEHRERTIMVAGENADKDLLQLLINGGIQHWVLPEDGSGRLDLKAFIEKCREREITGVFIEGGAALLSSFVRDKLLSYLFAYRAALIFADDEARGVFGGKKTLAIEDGIRLYRALHSSFGSDQLMRGFLVYPES